MITSTGNNLAVNGGPKMAENKDIHDGGCMCGAVRYRIQGPFSYSAHCHCRSCQRAVGAGFVTYTAVPSDRLEIRKGEMAIYNSSSGVRRGYCRDCGTSLLYAAEGWDDPAIMTATLDDPSVATPSSNAYTADKLTWVMLDPALKEYRHFP